MTRTTPKHPADPIPDEMVMAAIDRAARHCARDHVDVPGWAITEHLGIGRRSAAARHVRSRLAALVEAGRLERSRRHGITVWALTRSGRRHLERARRSGGVPALPESPQHRRWRDAQTLAEQEIERFHQALRTSIDEAVQMLDSRPAVSSDAWFEMSERLRRATWRVGSATYCLHEWVEPHDEQADVDNSSDSGDERRSIPERARRRALRSGRRSTRLWLDRGSC